MCDKWTFTKTEGVKNIYPYCLEKKPTSLEAFKGSMKSSSKLEKRFQECVGTYTVMEYSVTYNIMNNSFRDHNSTATAFA